MNDLSLNERFSIIGSKVFDNENGNVVTNMMQMVTIVNTEHNNLIQTLDDLKEIEEEAMETLNDRISELELELAQYKS